MLDGFLMRYHNRIATTIGGTAAVEMVWLGDNLAHGLVATAIGGAAAVEIAGCCEIVVRVPQQRSYAHDSGTVVAAA